MSAPLRRVNDVEQRRQRHEQQHPEDQRHPGQEPAGDGPADPVRAVAHVRGRVQGVGFRWWARARALELGLAGHASNLPDGRVEVSVQGARADVEALLELLQEQPSTHSRPGSVTGVTVQWHPPRPTAAGFVEK